MCETRDWGRWRTFGRTCFQRDYAVLPGRVARLQQIATKRVKPVSRENMRAAHLDKLVSSGPPPAAEHEPDILEASRGKKKAPERTAANHNEIKRGHTQCNFNPSRIAASGGRVDARARAESVRGS